MKKFEGLTNDKRNECTLHNTFLGKKRLFSDNIRGNIRSESMGMKMKRQSMMGLLVGLVVIMVLTSTIANAVTMPNSKKDGWLWPVLTSKHISRGYNNSGHQGLDITGGVGSVVRATKAGKVVRVFSGCHNHNGAGNRLGCAERNAAIDAGTITGEKCALHNTARLTYKRSSWTNSYTGTYCDQGYGNGVIIDHLDGTYSRYAHMDAVSVSVDEDVHKGDQIGTMGESGNCDGAHLHFAISSSISGGEYNNNPNSTDFAIRVSGGTTGNSNWNQEAYNNTGYAADDNGITYSFTIGKRLNLISENGTIQQTPQVDNSSVNKGTQISLTATPESGYAFTSWSFTGLSGVSETSNPLVFDMPDNDVTITANYKFNSFAVTKKWMNLSQDIFPTYAQLSATLKVGTFVSALGIQYPHKVTNVRIGVSTRQDLLNGYWQWFDTPSATTVPITGGKNHLYSFSANSSNLLNDGGQSLSLTAGTTYYYRWVAVINDEAYTSDLGSFTVGSYNSSLTNVYLDVIPRKEDYEEGETVTFKFGGDYPRTDFYLHKIIDGNDTSEKVGVNTDSGSATVTLSIPGEIHYYIGAENANNRSNGMNTWDNQISLLVIPSVVPAAGGGSGGQTGGETNLVSWTGLHTEDDDWGLFNGYVNWNKSLTMNEVGCFVSTNQSNVVNATRNSHSGCEMKYDTTIYKKSSMTTETTYGTIVYYKGPSFGSITSFESGTTYYYKFYSITSDGKETHSAVESYRKASSGGVVDSTAPVIVSAEVKNITTTGFDVICHITDNIGVTRTSFAVWNGGDTANDQDDLQWYTVSSQSSGSAVDGTWVCHVNIANHNNEHTSYYVDVRAYDAAENVNSPYTHLAGILVKEEITSIRIDGRYASLWPRRGETKQLTVTTDPADYDKTTLVWTSSNNAIVSVSNSGLVTAHHMTNNPVEITCKTADGRISDTINVYVISNLDSSSTFYVDRVPVSFSSSAGEYGIIALVREPGDMLECNVGVSFTNDVRSYDVEYQVVEGNVTLNNGTLFIGKNTANKNVVTAHIYDKYDDGSRGLEMASAKITVFKDINGGTFTLPASLKSIEESAFDGVAARKYMIPSSLTTLSPGSLKGIPTGSRIYFNSNTIGMFDDFEVLGLTVADARSEDYEWIDTGSLNMGYFFGTEGVANYYFLADQVSYYWSDWGTTVPENGAEYESKTQYRSRSKSTSTSYSEWGNWISNGTTPITSNDLREVKTVAHAAQTKTVYTYNHYKYYHTTNGAWYYTYVDNSGNSWSSQGSWEYAESDTPYTQYKWASSDGYDGWRDGSNIPWFNQGIWEETVAAAYTEYQYRTRTTTQQTTYGDWSSWSDTAVAGTDALEVETRTVYRTKVYN